MHQTQRSVKVIQPPTQKASDLYIDHAQPIPSFKPEQEAKVQVLIKVFYAGVNRADVMQRKGFYPPPPGSSPILGLEVAGVIEKFSDHSEECGGFKVGERVMALVEGGAYQEYCIANITQLFHCPNQLSLKEGAAIPEAYLTGKYYYYSWLLKYQ